MASSSAPFEYPSSGELNVLVQRFKLLNLVQRVAHRDVSEMIDTVGLESLARKGTLTKWLWVDGKEGDNVDGSAHSRRGAQTRYTAVRSAEGRRYRATTATAASTRYVRDRTTSPPGPSRMSFGRPTTGFEARVAAARWSSGVEEDNDEESRKHGVTRRVDVSVRRSTGGGQQEGATRRRYVVRRTQRVLRSSPADRDAFFSRLAEPRERPEPVVEEVLVYGAEPDSRGGRVGPARSGREAQETHSSREGQRDQQYDYYATQHRRHGLASNAASLSTPEPRLSYSSSQDANRGGAAARSFFDANDIRAHYGAESPMFLPHPHPRFPPPSVEVSSQPGEGRYANEYPSLSGEESRRRFEHEEEKEGASPASLPPPPLSQRQQQRLSPPPLLRSALEETVEPHEMDFTPPPKCIPTARLVAPAANMASSADSPVQPRSVNFVLGGKDERGSMPTGDHAASLSGNDGAVHLSAGAGRELAASPSAAYEDGCEHGATSTPVVPHLRFQHVDSGETPTEVDDVAGASAAGLTNLPDNVRGSGGSNSALSPSGLKTRVSLSSAGLPKSPRLGRGLAPKAKPKGAVEDFQVPVEAVRHAAALITRSGSSPASQSSPVTSTPGSSYVAAQRSLQQQQQRVQVSGARTPLGVPAIGSSGILLSPRPRTVNVNADRRAQHVDGSRQFPEAPVASLDPARSTPSFSTPTSAATTSTAATNACARDSTAVGTSAALPVDEGAQHFFQEVSSKVDHMLQNMQRMLQRVYKDDGEVPDRLADAAQQDLKGPSRGGGARGKPQSSDSAYSSSFVEPVNGGAFHIKGRPEVDLEGDAVYREFDGIEMDSEEDEMLLYTQVQHRVSRLDAEVNRLALPNSSEDGEGSELRGTAAAAVATASRQAETSSAAAAPPSAFSASTPGWLQGARPAASRRARGQIPDAIVQRLCAYRMEHFQHIAYNERLWNTSTTSQFVFAQRLTAALLEECWAEVIAEVEATMSEYVEGLVDHELQ
ncbi:hypothetical protein ABL78_0819 [Leptomonas seymouri]|uniref:Uncharacterized protein n=1 Tax=Leptomonas seymouri TaxID=5684 RepID=A0A0N0P8K8_LEPSE|nr:hypothetical protein ABL78_0819 [Leptomonas seymouri]|eukprot:KPI90066.1 hypothetical protein ABL78_0819 [Leptomonas seymouri]